MISGTNRWALLVPQLYSERLSQLVFINNMTWRCVLCFVFEVPFAQVGISFGSVNLLCICATPAHIDLVIGLQEQGTGNGQTGF